MKDKILHLIRESQEPLSGEVISRSLNISRSAIWKHIRDLRKDGYLIKATPHIGYQLESAPDKLIPLEIQNGLKTRFVGKKMVYLKSVDTTMDVAFKLGVEGAVEGTLVCAETQTKGKGRMGRKWISPCGMGLYFSVILRPSLHPVDVSKLTLMSAVAVCEALRCISDVPVGIKWPNDLLVGNKKIGGILTELSAEMDRVRFVVVGVGINVNAASKQLPDVGTSLNMEAGQRFDRVEILQTILECLEEWYKEITEQGFERMITKWKEYSCTLGKQVRFMHMNKELQGTAIDLGSNGELLIKDDNGKIYPHLSGDVQICYKK